MTSKEKIVWYLYFCIHAFFVIQKTLDFFHPTSVQHLYFKILIGFDSAYIVDYLLTSMQITLNLIHLAVLYFYINENNFFKSAVWLPLLILRFIFDIVGHSYQMHHLVAIARFDFSLAIWIFLRSVITVYPSYLGCYRYAFKS